MTRQGWLSSSGRIASRDGRMQSWGARRPSSGRNSTAHTTDGRLHRCEQGRNQGRADLQGTADCPANLMLSPGQADLKSGRQSRGDRGEDTHCEQEELWCAEGACADKTRLPPGRPMHGRTADGSRGITGLLAEKRANIDSIGTGQ